MKPTVWTLVVAAVVAVVVCGVPDVGESKTPARSGVHPVIMGEMSSAEDQTAIVIGGIVDGRWRKAKDVVRRMRGGEHYRLYTDTGFASAVTGTKPELYDLDDYHYIISLPPKPDSWCLGIAGDWDAMPRKARAGSLMQKAYLDAVRGVLRNHGMPKAKPSIKGVFRVDLEGDGQDEVVVSASTKDYPTAEYRQGDYSLVLLRKIAKGKLRTYLLTAEFHTKKAHRDSPIPQIYDVAGFYDVDGDGVLEIVTRWWCPGADAGGLAIHKIRGARPVLLLREGTGH